MADFVQVRGFEDAVRPPIRQRRARLTDPPGRVARARPDMAPRARLDRIARRVPEVMVKVTGRTRDGGHLKSHLAYIGRNGKLPLEGPDGERIQSPGEVTMLVGDWMAEVEADPRRRRDSAVSLSIVLSMPPGTDPFRMHDASRAFARRTFSDSHPYVFAFHTDERHPHVHLTVRILGHDGRKLNPRKADLERWRQTFAAALRDRGVEAEATPRRARGIVKKAETSSVHRIRARFSQQEGPPPKVDVAAVRDALNQVRETPWVEASRARQTSIRRYFVAQALALSRSGRHDDRKLAEDLQAFVKAMPPVRTRAEEILSRALERRTAGIDRSECSRGPTYRRR
ncbi:relaxase/mobilization nuclease domain-containing protein [Brevundimonas sp.]|jgi:type IV secretory pathway VirD2 relaxase|uniref:relaxase/mobilization nuclease domain-containing protein n=1 Tax=Brevundimonas sp. TaxID=1871086 RepID=UPI0037BFD2C1